MKILNVVQVYYPSVGGTQILFKNLSEKCVEYFGDEVDVYTTDSYFGPDKTAFKKIELVSEIHNGVSIRRFPFMRFHRSFFLFIRKLMWKIFDIKMEILSDFITGPWSPKLKRAMEKTKADIIVGAAAGYMHTTYPLWRRKIKNHKPFICQTALHFYHYKNHSPLNKKNLQALIASDGCLANTVYEKERLIELGIDSDKITVTGIGISLQDYIIFETHNYREKLKLDECDILVGYIGRIEAYKNIDVLIDSFEILSKENKNIHLLIAGLKCDYANELIASVNLKDDEIKNKIHFLEDIPEHKKPALYHSLDIFVLPSVNESFGMVFLEAWACKKPVVGANIGAIASIIANNIDGLLMEPGNKIDLAAKILQLADNPYLRKIMGEKGFEKVAENYTWQTVTKKYRAACSKAIERYNLAGKC